MNFHEALNQICDGKRVTRKEWKDKKTYCLMHDNFLRIHINGKYCDWIVSYGDLLSEDWKVL